MCARECVCVCVCVCVDRCGRGDVGCVCVCVSVRERKGGQREREMRGTERESSDHFGLDVWPPVGPALGQTEEQR